MRKRIKQKKKKFWYIIWGPHDRPLLMRIPPKFGYMIFESYQHAKDFSDKYIDKYPECVPEAATPQQVKHIVYSAGEHNGFFWCPEAEKGKAQFMVLPDKWQQLKKDADDPTYLPTTEFDFPE